MNILSLQDKEVVPELKGEILSVFKPEVKNFNGREARFQNLILGVNGNEVRLTLKGKDEIAQNMKGQVLTIKNNHYNVAGREGDTLKVEKFTKRDGSEGAKIVSSASSPLELSGSIGRVELGTPSTKLANLGGSENGLTDRDYRNRISALSAAVTFLSGSTSVEELLEVAEQFLAFIEDRDTTDTLLQGTLEEIPADLEE